MSTYLIYKNEEEINRIIADESFCRKYCAQNGYTYERYESATLATPILGAPPSDAEQLRADVDYIAALMGVML